MGSGLTALAAVSGLSAKSIDLGDPNSVSPGILGFLAFFLLAIALYLLVRNMNSHLRRVRYRQEALEAEEAQAQAQAARDAEADAADAADPADQAKPAP
jgi:large-conductance mechanosensitive channel